MKLFADPVPTDPTKTGWSTSEWIATMAYIVKNSLMVLVMIGVLSAQTADEMGGVIASFMGAAVLAVSEGIVLYRYITSRILVKQEVLKMETVRLQMQGPKA